MSIRLVATMLGAALAMFVSGCSAASSDDATAEPAGTETKSATSVSGEDRGKHVEWKHAFFGFTYGGPGTVQAGSTATAPEPAPALVLNVVLTNRPDYCTAVGTKDPSLLEGSFFFNAPTEGVIRSPRIATEEGGAAVVELTGMNMQNGATPKGPAQSPAIGLTADVTMSFYDATNAAAGSATGRMEATRCVDMDYGRQ